MFLSFFPIGGQQDISSFKIHCYNKTVKLKRIENQHVGSYETKRAIIYFDAKHYSAQLKMIIEDINKSLSNDTLYIDQDKLSLQEMDQYEKDLNALNASLAKINARDTFLVQDCKPKECETYYDFYDYMFLGNLLNDGEVWVYNKKAANFEDNIILKCAKRGRKLFQKYKFENKVTFTKEQLSPF